jgi:putative ABC transport system permease protein
MLRPRWRKVLKDLGGNKIRTVLVVLSIAIGVLAVGMIVGTQVLLDEDLAAVYGATNPAHVIISLDGFDPELLDSFENVAGVAEVDARREWTMPLLLGADERLTLRIIVHPNFEAMRLHTVAPLTGAWPPPDDSIIIERASLPYTEAEVGDTLQVETADGRIRQLTIAGTAHDVFVEPVQFSNQPIGYVNRETMEWLGYGRTFDQLHVRLAGDNVTLEQVEAVAKLVEDKIERAGLAHYYTYLPEPGEHPASEVVQPMLAILGVLGFLCLCASGFLVVNIINGLLAQHTQQIGIMKAVGARRSQIVVMYLVAVVIFGLLSLLVAVPLGALAAHGLAGFIASLINFELAGFRIPLNVLVVQTAVAILVPVLAAMVPVLRGAAITVREALSEHGLGKGHFGSSPLDRFVNWLSATVLRLSRPMRISLRNTIRRKARLLLTLFTLTLGGAIFIGVLSVHASLLGTLDDALRYFAYDVSVDFAKEHRIEEISRVARQIPGVAMAESWIGASVQRVQADDGEGEDLGENFFILGIAPDAQMIQPTLLEGRWLQPGDENALVVNSLVIKEEPDLQLGDMVRLKVDGRESNWHIVGIVQGVLTGGIAYADQDYLARQIRFVGKATGVQIVGEDSSPAFQRELETRLRDHFESEGFEVVSTGTTADLRETIEYQFNIIVVLLTVMAVLLALVGGLGLTGAMSINVLERTREIGVMRAVGASDSSILKIVLVEGVTVGLISWLFGSLLAYPIGKFLSDTVGRELLEAPLNYRFAADWAAIWLLMIIVIAIFASFLPAWNASRLSVRETLAYE